MHNVRLKEIAILTPYSAQKEIIKQLAVKAKLLYGKGGEAGAEIKVATITESQGISLNQFMYPINKCTVSFTTSTIVQAPKVYLYVTG